MLPLAAAFCTAWVAVFLLLSQPGLAVLLAFAALVLSGCWIVATRICLSTGLVLAQALCSAITTVFCLSVDLPSQAVPRTTHGYFLVVALVGYMDYRREPRFTAVAMILAAICGFVAFSSLPLQFGFARPPSEPIQMVIAYINPLATVLLLAACLFFVQRHAATNRRVARDLAHAVARGELELRLSPQVDRSRRIIGAEAVLVWNRSEGPLDADVVSLVAREAGLVGKIEAWMLSEAVLTLSRWQLRSHTYDLVLTVGLSVENLCAPGVVAELSDTLRKHGVHGRYLRVDLDGRDVSAGLAPIQPPLEQLRALGVSASLKFSARDSSLADLERLPLQHIDLDAELSRDACERTRSATLARNIVQLAQALDLQVLARGIDCEAQFDFMRGCGCDTFQGQLFGEPMSPQSFDTHVHARVDELTWIEESAH